MAFEIPKTKKTPATELGSTTPTTGPVPGTPSSAPTSAVSSGQQGGRPPASTPSAPVSSPGTGGSTAFQSVNLANPLATAEKATGAAGSTPPPSVTPDVQNQQFGVQGAAAEPVVTTQPPVQVGATDMGKTPEATSALNAAISGADVPLPPSATIPLPASATGSVTLNTGQSIGVGGYTFAGQGVGNRDINAAGSGAPALTAPKGTREYREQAAARNTWRDQKLSEGYSLEQLGSYNKKHQGLSVHSAQKALDAFGPSWESSMQYDLVNGQWRNVATSDENGHEWEPIPPDVLRQMQEWEGYKNSSEGAAFTKAYKGAYAGWLRRGEVEQRVAAGDWEPLPGGGYVDVGLEGPRAFYDAVGKPLREIPPGYYTAVQQKYGVQLQPGQVMKGYGSLGGPGEGQGAPPSGGTSSTPTTQPPVPATNMRGGPNPGAGSSTTPAAPVTPPSVAPPTPSPVDPGVPAPGSTPTVAPSEPGVDGGQVATAVQPGAQPVQPTQPTQPAQPGVQPGTAPSPNVTRPPTSVPPRTLPPSPGQAQTPLTSQRFTRASIAALPNGSSVQTPLGLLSKDANGNVTVTLNAQGQAAYQRRMQRAHSRFGPVPSGVTVLGVEMPVVPGQSNYNPFTGTWS